MRRETAWRVFAGEYNDSTFEVKGSGEKTPSYVITPLGAKVNRLFIVGVLTDVENISESGELVRGHISDPTGVYTLYSGQYQQDATDALLAIEVPAFVAVLGKARTYKPEEGVLYVSVRPERIMEVNAEARDQWILETCESTKERIEAVFEAMKMNPANAYDLRKLGYSKDLSDGVVAALKNYGRVDVEKYITLLHESLQHLKPRREEFASLDIEVEEGEKKPIKAKKTKDVKKETIDDFEEIENKVLVVIKEIEGEDGASWDAIAKRCEKSGLSRDSVEEVLNSLMDKGLIYEPVLGIIKTT